MVFGITHTRGTLVDDVGYGVGYGVNEGKNVLRDLIERNEREESEI